MKPIDEHTPVIVGVGEITHREKRPEAGLEPVALMARAVRAAEQDAGAKLLAGLDSVDVVCQYSWPYADAPGLLARRLRCQPARNVYGVVGGEAPVRALHEAALRIARGESRVSLVVGAEAQYSVSAAAQLGARLPWSARDDNAKLLRGADYLPPLVVKHGVFQPITVYPFYENATLAHWGQTPRQAWEESCALWARYSEVAARNPHAWRREAFTAQDIAQVTPDNRRIAWPYTKRMVANPLVNMGAAVFLTSVGHARALGIAPQRWVYVWGGAAAEEPRDYLLRDQYHRSHAQDLVLETVLQQTGGVSPFEMLELYSCFPVVPKMARRTLGLGPDAQMTSTGGLSFFGAPLSNYMTHAAAGLVHALRAAPGKTALLYGQGEYVTKHHALVMGTQPAPQGLPAQDYRVQAQADARRGAVPPLVLDYAGQAALETFTVIHGRDGRVAHGVVIARTPQGQRLMARVAPDDTATLAVLTDLDRSPVGRQGDVTAGEDGLLRWRAA
ncbi:acetyl-CoA acetyltransferase [Rhodoferax koreense]|uniref:Acetyl-CoA acetyltransferase n=1 Tax=Rhodoferax koreensis TaxID=1842727 RepID=A0A1P8K2Q3_9BURK|nr:acetyl-CoA acetyltransferase [Rhodoferax koreense]APW40279.1 acetyl-CoA acetyltransferase [Rhodoferax koreense]